jgi:hypothetical protein
VKTASNPVLKFVDKLETSSKIKNFKVEEIKSIQKIIEEQKAFEYIKKTYRM